MIRSTLHQIMKNIYSDIELIVDNDEPAIPMCTIATGTGTKPNNSDD